MCRFAWTTTFLGLLFGQAGVEGHVYLMEPVSRNFFYTSAFQDVSFKDINYCPHCYQSRGPMAVRARAEANTPEDTLNKYGGGAWPHKSAYDRGELSSNGNYLEIDEISVRHGICGDPEQTAAEGSNTFGQENKVYPVLKAYQEGSVIEMKVVVSTFHWGHLEFFICNSEDLPKGEDSVVTQGCFNMHPLTRAEDDGEASPIDPAHPGRYHLDPPCREKETDQTKVAGAVAGYVVTGRYQLPEGLTCERCIVQMVYYTGNSCKHPGYGDFVPDDVPAGCAPTARDWIHLDPPDCGAGAPYPEEFWNCADIAITPGEIVAASTPAPFYEGAPTVGPTPVPQSSEPPTSLGSPTAPTVPPTPPPLTDASPSGGASDDCSEPVASWGQCGGANWKGSTCCTAGYECIESQNFYSQCKPIKDDCSFHWEQCGGKNWSGPSCCTVGSVCTADNEYFSKCVPEVP